MRRLAPIAAFALFLAVPLWAQHGGGHGGGGGGSHAGGFSGGHMGGGHAGFSAGHASGGHAFAGMRSSPSVSRSFSHTRPFSRPTFSSRAFNGRGPFLHDRFRDRFRDRGFRNNCFGFRCGAAYPWWGYDPWLWSDDSSYDQSYEQDLANANEMNQQSLEQQQMWRQEEADADQDIYARSVPSAPRATEPASAQPATPQPDTVLIFRDQHKQEVQNYAIVGHTLWNFAAQRTQKIPLADLDLAATVKANDDRGVTFRVPTANDVPAPPANMQGQPSAPAVKSSSSV
jgi:hypothetical protein